jgi:hypothetical protein
MKRIIVIIIAALVMAYALLLVFNVPFPIKLDFGLGLDGTGRTAVGLLIGVLSLLIFMLAPEKPKVLAKS